jgi:LPPG:FO 2-phospho-L-lactate transferase
MALNNAADSRQIVALAGGVGGAKLAHGLARVLPPGALTVIINTGDDFRYLGLAVSPDLDTVMYTLAGIAHPGNGWGIDGDTRQMIGMLERYGEPVWFSLGDRDLATNLLRTRCLDDGLPLSVATARLAGALGVTARLLPMTDDRIATMLETDECGVLEFQEYFVRYRWQPRVRHLWYEGAAAAHPAPGVIEAIESASAIVICPSNPVLSIEPILRVPGIREAVKRRKEVAIAVSPVIHQAAVKGPTVKIMTELGLDPSAQGIAAYYEDLVEVFVVDSQDQDTVVGPLQKKRSTNILMNSVADRERLAREVLDWVGSRT